MRLSVIVLALLVSCVAVHARLEAEFDVQGLELLSQRYGQAYPGFGNVGQAGLGGYGSNLMQQQQFGLGMDQQNMGQQWSGLNMGNVGGFGLGQQQQLNLGGYGGVGSFGGGGQAGGSKKTTVAAPIYAESMIVPKIITQPILRPHMVTQPIIQQQLIQQPIVETRQVIQPVIRRIITQPIIRPKILESTTIQPTLKTETTVQPHIIQQTVVTPQLQNVPMENAPIQEAPTTQMQQPVVQPTVSAKKSHSGLSGLGGY